MTDATNLRRAANGLCVLSVAALSACAGSQSTDPSPSVPSGPFPASGTEAKHDQWCAKSVDAHYLGRKDRAEFDTVTRHIFDDSGTIVGRCRSGARRVAIAAGDRDRPVEPTGRRVDRRRHHRHHPRSTRRSYRCH